MKFGAIDFPQPLLDALRDKRLVVFAGAGVSMGPPARLPSFLALAKQIAEGRVARELNPAILDRELGDLERDGVQVHRLCREIIQAGPPHINEIHKALLRLFGDITSVRLVTTNYDPHFTNGALELWQRAPAIYGAPALPLGRCFRGIVHVHGSLLEDSSMVLTDSDFGRAYLTEGWARRFLLEVFSNYTVLFVGYSHEETVMQYLARALPPALTKDRFALIHSDDKTDSWRSLGITPVHFPSRGDDRYIELGSGIAELAAAECRGVLDLQADIGKIAASGPPHDQAMEDQVRDAIGNAPKLRFFTQSAKPSLWLEWLDDRGLLNPLFSPARLDDAAMELCKWVVKDVLDDSNALMAVAGNHKLEFNKWFWDALAASLAHIKEGQQPPPRFSRWLLLLLAKPPAVTDDFTMLSLATMAARMNDFDGVMLIFEQMCRSEVSVALDLWPGVDWIRGSGTLDLKLRLKTSSHIILRLWTSTIKPRLPELHGHALAACVEALEARAAIRRRWEPGRASWDWDSSTRAGIEPHQQDRVTSEMRPLIDGARDCLEWVAANRDGAELREIVSKLWHYKAPLVKRVAIHAMIIGQDSDDDKLAWLFGVGAQDRLLRHEVFALLRASYPNASPPTRSEAMAWVASFQAPVQVEESNQLEVRDSLQLEVLWWLKDSDPDCQLVQAALEPLVARHPDWVAAKHPDILVAHTRLPAGQRPSPVGVDELLGKPPAEWLDMLMNYEQERPFGPTREGLWLAAQEAAKRNEVWQRDLLTVLKAQWDSSLWSTLIAGWGTWPDDADAAVERLQWLAQPELQQHHASTASFVLRSLVHGPVKPYVVSLIPRADQIFRGLCAALEAEQATYDGSSWLDQATNRPSGALAEYLMDSLQLRPDAGHDQPVGLSAEVEQMCARLLNMASGHDAFVRPVMAQRLSWLTDIAPDWAAKTVAPWLSSPDDVFFCQAWDGFLQGGRFTIKAGQIAKQAFLTATERIERLLPGRLDDFVEAYVTYMQLDIDPLPDWVPHLIQHSGDGTRKMFAWHMHRLLGHEPAARVAAWWKDWLKTYWERRINGIPKPLAGDELPEMIAWPAVLPEAYEDAVRLVSAMPAGRLEYTTLFDDLVERQLHKLHPEATAVYLTTVLQWPGAENLHHEFPNVIREMDRSKISLLVLNAFEAAIALSGLRELQWGAAPAEPAGVGGEL